ncbi:MAG: hypothetical protein JNM88_18085 [Chitinophagaceae bacterium]|nr:hypothetical protein [Chitinophagaceae bacterium]
MKIISCILALYILVLSVTPCCIFDNCAEDEIDMSTSHPGEEEDCGNCSPFFSCEGCAAAVTTFTPPVFCFTNPEQSPVYIFHPAPPLMETEDDFWQPPRLG